ncbi:MAG: diguanylate cyclase, partial [Chloroflexota bacterium]|nr:diguanylate cyclase [Chloroflexota bacterium]
LAQRLLDNLRSRQFEGEPPLFLSASIGVASYPTEAADPSSLVELADQRAYLAKRGGRNRVDAGEGNSAAKVSPSPFGSSPRLIERDEALQSFGDFLDALAKVGKGAFSVLGQHGAGSSRFLQEAVTLGRLRGYLTIHLQGTPLLKETSFGALHQAAYDWLPASVQDVGEIAGLINEQVNTPASSGLIFAVDGIEALDESTLGVLRDVFGSSSSYPVCLVYTRAAQPERLLQNDVPLLGSVELQPLSRSGMGVWVRSLLRWEPPARFTAWLHRETSSLPARIERALLYLVERDVLTEQHGSWTLSGDYEDIKLARELGWEPKPRTDNLPALPYSFVGRGREMARLRDLLALNRVVTITGPGGVGKTHLALHAASEMLGDFQDSVFFVPLATVLDPEFVAPALAHALGVKVAGGASPVQALVAHLHDKKMLLLLDNLEQVCAVAPILSEIINGCPNLRVLATSREPLHLRGEHAFPLEPLAVPETQGLHAMGIESYPSVTLFVQRAQAVNPDFVLTQESAETVAAICSHLEGLPLAIELVAARTRLMPVKAILSRLGSRSEPTTLSLLTGGSRDLPARHQTLRSAIAWSYDLLSTDEQLLFASLGVFAGGFTLSAVEEIFASPGSVLSGASVLDLVASLLDKSLLRVAHEASTMDEPRYTMLGMLREFACERLDVAGERDKVARLHADYFMRLADETEAKLTGPDQKPVLARLAREHDNLRAALTWSVNARESE